MNLQERYGKDYILMAGLKQYIESGIMLASVNFWRDSAQGFKELKIIENKEELLNIKPEFKNCDFLVAFINEDFPVIEEEINEDVFSVTLPIIEEKEGEETVNHVKEFLIEYALRIAKASKEDWLAFIGIKDSISDEEEAFIEKIKTLLN